MAAKSDMLTIVKERFGDSSNAIFTDTYYNHRLQEAYTKVSGASPFWPWLNQQANGSLVVAAGAQTVTLPTNFRRALAVFNDTDDLPMAQITGRREYRALYPTDDITGPPQHYRLAYPYLYVYPTPEASTTIVLDYDAKPTTFASNGDTPEWPEDWHYMLTEWALAQAYLDDGNLDQYKVHMSVFEQQLAELKLAMLDAQGDGYPQIDDNFFE